MKKIKVLLACVAMTAQTYAADNVRTAVEPQEVVNIDGAFMGTGWNSNWFLQGQVGMHAFIGTPTGCGDLWDRTKFVAHFAVGKWITPTVAVRLAMQGFRMKDANLESQKLLNIHADLMYNITNWMRDDYSVLRKWSLSPLLGVGFIKNGYSKPFAMTAGINIGYRLTNRLQLTAEASNTLTWQDFDGYGDPCKLGDNLAQVSVGLTYTIGKNGWKSVVDYRPLYSQYKDLQKTVSKYQEEKRKLMQTHEEDQIAISELKKILELEGLLEKYDIDSEQIEKPKGRTKNIYSGLISLKKRIFGKLKKEKPVSEPAYWNPNDTTTLSTREYTKMVSDGQLHVGSPIFFFFKKGVSQTMEEAQIVNVREISNAMKRFSLRARIIGAADSMTGTTTINNRLCEERASFLASKLRECGVAEEDISCEGRGGINDYRLLTANRNACVMLYTK